MDLLSHPFTVSILLLVLLILIFVWLAYRRIYPYRRLQAFLPERGSIDMQIPVGYFSQEDLAGGKLNRKHAKPAMLVLDARSDVAIYVLTRGDLCLHYRMPVTATRFDWFRSMLGGLLPPLLCLRFDGRSHYLFKRNRVQGSPVRTASKFYAELGEVIPDLPQPRLDNYKYLEWGVRGFAPLILGVVIVALVASWSPGMDEEPMVLVQQDDGEVYAASHRWLYRFDAEDHLIERIDMELLGISNGISDMESIDDGRFMVGDSGAGLIKICDFSVRHCKPLEGFADGGLFLRSFQFARDPLRERIYVADSSRHRLLELDAQGTLIREIAKSDSVCFPNDPQIVKDMLVIANTNHHKLLAWDLAEPDFSEPVEEMLTVHQGRDDVLCPAVFETPNTEYFAREVQQEGGSRAIAFSNARPGQIWPFVITPGQKGGLWVLNAGDNLQHADLMKFAEWPSVEKPRRIFLDETLDPIGLLVRRDDVLLVENNRPSILRLSHDGRLLGDFGDAKFTGLMASIGARQITYKRVARNALYLAGVLLLVLVVVLPVIIAFRIKYIQKQDPSFLPVSDQLAQ